MNSLIQGSPEWVKMRQSKIGASDAPIILGVSSYTTPYQLWEYKLGLKEQEVTLSMQRGHEKEEEARKVFEETTGFTVFPQVMTSKVYPWMIASVDGISIDGKILVEIKNVNKNDHQTALKGDVPQKFYPQCQHQMAVVGVNEMYYFSYNEVKSALVKVIRDDIYIADMIEKEKEFYRCMMEFDPPPLCDRDYVEREDEEWKKVADMYLSAQKSRRILEDHEETYRKELIRLSDGKNSIGGGVKATRFHRRGSIQYGKVPELLGVDLEPYRKPPIESWRIGEVDE